MPVLNLSEGQFEGGSTFEVSQSDRQTDTLIYL